MNPTSRQLPFLRPALAWPVLWLLVTGLAAWAYWPGLDGSFQFDDFANLPALGATGPIDDWPTFWRYITSGTADPTGRPLALLSFLIDAQNWPASPRPFLRTNLVLHLFNGGLLFALLYRLGRQLAARYATPASGQADRRVQGAALLGAALWLLHPLLVSTTLYIVQREAMLPATFTLLGLLAWLRGRDVLLGGTRPARGWAWMLLGLGLCTGLGVLSKANGILLPALALVLEWTLLRTPAGTSTDPAPARGRRHYRLAMLVLAAPPTLLVAGYLLHSGYTGLVHGIGSHRPWTLGQRLLTEPRVLMDYLALLWMPRPFTPGLFNDQILASASLLTPWTTLPCLLAVLALILGACLGRRRWPALAAAVLVYFVGQSLESSSIALELYFEHRNYLPALLMFWPLALWLCQVPQAPARAARPHPARPHRLGKPSTQAQKDVAKAMLALLLVLALAGLTHARANVWGHTHEQALLWARLNPDSPRAQANAAMAQMHAGRPALAAARLGTLLAAEPAQVQLAFNLFGAQCQMGHVPAGTLDAVNTAMARTRNPGSLLAHWFARGIAGSAHPPCPQLNLDTLEQFIHTGLSNPRLHAIPGRRQDLLSLLGRIALVRHRPEQALDDFNLALTQNPRTTLALEQAAQLGMHGYPDAGLAHLAIMDTLRKSNASATRGGWSMRRVHAWVLRHQHYWHNEETHLRATLQADAATKASTQP